MYFLPTDQQLRMNYCKALYAVCSVLPTNYSINSLLYLAFLAYTVHTRVLRVYSTFLWNGTGKMLWKGTGKQRYGTGEETQSNGMGQVKKHYRTERPVRSVSVQRPLNRRSHPVFIERAPHSTDRTGEILKHAVGRKSCATSQIIIHVMCKHTTYTGRFVYM